MSKKSSLMQSGINSIGPIIDDFMSDKFEENLIDTYREYLYYKVKEIQILLNTADFRSIYQSYDNTELDLYALSGSLSSDRVIFECFAKVREEQRSKIRTYEFISHSYFEQTITECTRCKDRPNSILSASRPWDVGYNLIIKVEALDELDQLNIRKLTLRREYNILKQLWHSYLNDSSFEFESMIGIPMVFDFMEVANSIYKFTSPECKRIDIYGQPISILQDKCINPAKSAVDSSLSYMTMEKLGPSVRYLMHLRSNLPSSNTSGHYNILTFDTAFKIFDQLICRLIVIHRLGVVHYDLSPEHLYFGRAPCENVLYLSHFKAAICLPETAEQTAFPPLILGNHRFIPVFGNRRGTSHPIDDIESAFYVLLSLVSSSLPWDVVDTIDLRLFKQRGDNSTSSQQTLNSASVSNFSNMVDFDSVADVKFKSNSETSRGSMLLNSFVAKKNQIDENKATLSLEFNEMSVSKIKEIKLNFWKNPTTIKKMLSRIEFEHNNDERPFSGLAVELIYDLYLKVKDILVRFTDDRLNYGPFCKSLMFNNTKEFKLYTDLRACVLPFFQFERHSDLFKHSSFMSTEISLSSRQVPRLAWDLSSWCFSNIEVLPNPKPKDRKSSIFAFKQNKP